MGLNLQALIDEVLGLARESMKQKNNANYVSGHDQTQARNNAIDDDLRKHRFAMEKQGLSNTGLENVQTLKNTGDLAQQEVINTGALARQRLASEATKYAADQGLRGSQYTSDNTRDSELYKADKSYTSEIYKTDKGFQSERVKALSAILEDNLAPPEDKKKARDMMLAMSRGKAPDDFNSFETSPIRTPAPAAPALPAVTAPTSPTRKAFIQPPAIEAPAISTIRPEQPPKLWVDSGASDDAAIKDYKRQREIKDIRNQLSPASQEKELQDIVGYKSRLPGAVRSDVLKTESEFQIQRNKKRKAMLDAYGQ